MEGKLLLFEGSKSSLEELCDKRFEGRYDMHGVPIEISVEENGYGTRDDPSRLLERVKDKLRVQAERRGASALVEVRYHCVTRRYNNPVGREPPVGQETIWFASGYVIDLHPSEHKTS